MKCINFNNKPVNLASLPAWERGLKFSRSRLTSCPTPSLPAWERGLKWLLRDGAETHDVAPRVGAWIEILSPERPERRVPVAPRVGAWIEIVFSGFSRIPHSVAPRVGAWIEILCWSTTSPACGSLPAWERGLKYSECLYSIREEKVAPRVGAWIEIGQPRGRLLSDRVAPRVGAWIEISSPSAIMPPWRSLPAWERGLKSHPRGLHTCHSRRSPRGSVD